jgi:hypothetical protein
MPGQRTICPVDLLGPRPLSQPVHGIPGNERADLDVVLRESAGNPLKGR